MQKDVITCSPAPHISDRFREMVKDREDDRNDVVLTGDEIVILYDILLSELSVNSKPIINELTIIAREQSLHAAGIADVICNRILEVPVEQKLPSLYLLDSIVKNIGGEYIKYFSARLPEVFCDAYKQVHPNMHPAMRHLFGTWSTVFPLPVLQNIESHLQFSSSTNHQSLGLSSFRASESLHPGHGVHINPKYVEARRQFGHETVDTSFQPLKGASTTSKICAQKHSIHYEEFSSDDGDTDVALVRSNRSASSSSPPGPSAIKVPPTFCDLIERSSCPYGVGRVGYSSPSFEELRVDNSPGRGAAPLDSGINYVSSGVVGSSARTWKNDFVSGVSKIHGRHPAAVRLNNVDVDRTRALIDAYGIDKRTDTTKHPDVEELQANGIDTESTMTWKSSEVEDFVWENMSPTLADDGRKYVFSSSQPISGSLRNTAPLASHLRKDWPNRTQVPVVNGSSIVDVPSSRNRLSNTGYGIHKGPPYIRGSSNLLESWTPAQNFNLSSTYQFNGTNGNNPRMPSSGSRILPSSLEQKPPSIGYSPDHNTQNQGPPFGSGGASAGVWSSTLLPGSHARPMLQSYQPNRQIRCQLDTLSGNNFLANQNVNSSSFSDHNIDSTGSILQNHMLPFTGHMARLPPHSFPQDMRHHMAPPSVVGFSPLLAPPLQRGYAPGHLASVGTIVPNLYTQSLMPNLSAADASARLPGPRAGAPNPHVGENFSNLISSLMSQGVISLNQTLAKEDPVGLEFSRDLLKVRHESAITCLYSELPRQCTTCGLRFKLQEAHSSHMDWHVTKNRVTRNRKQKPSRKWFVSVNLWLTGAEALGTDTVPNFLPSDDIVEKKDDEQLAVPADDDQKFCALCGEPFDDFYCDEIDEWMYKEAVYMNAPSGLTENIDRSQLGPIVHVKCRSDTGAVSEDMKKSDLDFTEEGSQRKRMRS